MHFIMLVMKWEDELEECSNKNIIKTTMNITPSGFYNALLGC